MALPGNVQIAEHKTALATNSQLMKLQIKDLILDNNLVLAPLAGITNLPFRLLVKQTGCGLVCSEMVSAHGIVYNSKKTLEFLISDKTEKPISIQIFGAKPDIMAEAAKIVESNGADILDINFGCSVRKILHTGAGSALMKDPELTKKILNQVRNAIKIPFTIKIRSGWDYSGEDAFKICQIAEDCGVDAIAIHPRTAKQGFGGNADWSIIEKVKEKSKIPIIGNGDIIQPEDALKMLNQTNCDGIMIGRAAVSNPWIFEQVIAHLKEQPIQEVSLEKRFEYMRRYYEHSIEVFGEQRACRMMRSRLGWFSKSLPLSSKFRDSIKHISTKLEGLDLITNYKNEIISFNNERDLL